MNIILCIVSIAFGDLSLIAAVSQIRVKGKAVPTASMIIGSIMLIAAVICNITKQQYDYVLALIGCTAICVSAVCNGLKSGNFHIQHHIIRITLSLILTIGFVLL